MSSRKTNWRLKTWEKLCKFKLTDKKQIVKLQLEDLKDVISDPTFQNILEREMKQNSLMNPLKKMKERRKLNA